MPRTVQPKMTYTKFGETAKITVKAAGNGTIDGNKSYISFLDQSQEWGKLKLSNGVVCSTKSNIDTKKTFAAMYSESFIPFTFAEFLGTDPVEALTYQFGHAGAVC